MIIFFANIFRIIDVVYAIQLINDANPTSEYVSTMTSVFVLDIIIVIILMLTCLLQIAVTFIVKSKYALYYASVIILALLNIEKIYIIIASNAALAWAYDILAGEVMLFLMLAMSVLTLTASAIVRKMVRSDIPSSILGLASSACFTIVMFIYLVSLQPADSIFSKLYCVILIAGCVGLILRFVFNIRGDRVPTTAIEIVEEEEAPAVEQPIEEPSPVEEEPQPVEEVKEEGSDMVNDDIEAALTRLKDLYDKGLITTEEYNEKRKKYIDKL